AECVGGPICQQQQSWEAGAMLRWTTTPMLMVAGRLYGVAVAGRPYVAVAGRPYVAEVTGRQYVTAVAGRAYCSRCITRSPLVTKSNFSLGAKRLYYSNSSTQDPSLRRFLLYKRIFAVSLFTGTLVLAWYLRKKKGTRLKALLEDFTRLPLDKSLFGCDMSVYRYKGHVFPGQLVMSGIFQELPNFRFKSDDVVVASYPKTGTTWVQEIVYMLTHNFQKSDETSEVLETRFPYLEYPYPGIRWLSGQVGARYIKTHLPYHLLPSSFDDSNAKLVYITRNPRDTAVSYFYFMRLLTQSSYEGSFSSFITMFLNDMVLYSPFFDHVLGYWKLRKNPNIFFVSYEELHQDPVTTIRKLAEFLEVDATEDDVNYVAACTSFSSMLTNPSVNYDHWKDLGFAYKDKGRFLRKGEVGGWQTHLNKEQLAAFEQWEDEHLKDTDLTFTFTLPSDTATAADTPDHTTAAQTEE
ncbi:hypothetical protein OTU49_004373, partial [Cherax quadricarinatus]